MEHQNKRRISKKEKVFCIPNEAEKKHREGEGEAEEGNRLDAEVVNLEGVISVVPLGKASCRNLRVMAMVVVVMVVVG